MGTDTVKHIADIFKRINLTQLTTGNQAVDDSSPFSTSVTSGKEPIFSSNSDDTQDTLGKIVVNMRVRFHEEYYGRTNDNTRKSDGEI